MGRSPCCDPKDIGLKKGPWTPEEDTKLTQYIHTHGPGNWRNLPRNAGLQRCGKSCRLRWTNYLRPDIKRGRFSFDEEETIIQLHSVLGNKWSAIAARLPGRTDNEIKNYWNTHIRKRLLRSGIDPVTHAPRLDFFDLSSLLNSPQLDLSNLLRLQTLLNPEALRLALSILSSSNNENPNALLQKIQETQFLNSDNIHHDHNLQFQPNQFDQSQQMNIPSNITTLPLPNHQGNNMGHVSLVSSTNCSSGSQNDQILFQDFVPTTSDQSLPSNLSSSFYYGGSSSDQIKGDHLSENSSFGNSSVLSTPSTSTFFNGSIEDEKESFCSDLLRFEIPESLDLGDFM